VTTALEEKIDVLIEDTEETTSSLQKKVAEIIKKEGKVDVTTPVRDDDTDTEASEPE